MIKQKQKKLNLSSIHTKSSRSQQSYKKSTRITKIPRFNLTISLRAIFLINDLKKLIMNNKKITNYNFTKTNINNIIFIIN